MPGLPKQRPTDGPAITELAAALYEAKEAERAAQARRIELELALAERLECAVDKSKTHELDGWKATVKRPLIRKLLKDEWAAIESCIPPELRPVTYEPKLDEKGVRWIEENRSDLWALVSRAIETKPGKVAVSVERITKQ